ncbi:carbohydrate ABC transporter permease [Brachybacterium sp. ACRRE]|uniref:carbohydrate ABC transporter permease n=1 Tax=Brachybacterium sp. ACRRE TaxID=2918184 RepID=UPI001EF22003|nr:sugar ABC transporter permease [Brachybacterium sp. ACRRE]MCG7310291.1 sugar ABC transporter permease [Brachybacterium sp. ACRRE]
MTSPSARLDRGERLDRVESGERLERAESVDSGERADAGERVRDAARTRPARGTERSTRGAPGRERVQLSHVLFALPALGFFAIFALLPLVGVLVLSFTSWNGIGAITFTGLTSWGEVLTRSTTWHGLALVVLMIVATWVLQTPLSILLGTFLAGRQRYRNVLAVLYFLPLLLSSAAIAITFKSLLDPNFGLASGLNMPFLKQNWLGDATLVWIVLLVIIAWQFIPFHTLIYQGAVRQIPQTMYEAAQIDGAGRVRQFFSITLPQLKYTLITSSTLMVVGALTYFDIIFVLTQGGPGSSTRILPLDMYLTGFRGNEMGVASALAVILVVLGLGLALGVQRLGGKDASASQTEGA